MSEPRRAKRFGYVMAIFCLVYSIVIFFRYFMRYSPAPIIDVLCLAMVGGAAAFGIVILWLYTTRNQSFREPMMKQSAFALIWALSMAVQFGVYSYVWIVAQILGVFTVGLAVAFLVYQIRFWRTQ
jgi:hypothetical protein